MILGCCVVTLASHDSLPSSSIPSCLLGFTYFCQAVRVLGCSAEELYRETNGKRGRRRTLPLVAQEALMVGEIAAAHELNQAEPLPSSEPQGRKNRYATNLAADGAEKMKPGFPWSEERA